MHISPVFLAAGIAGALHRYLAETGAGQTAQQAAQALRQLAGMECDAAVKCYQMLCAGAPAREIFSALEKERRAANEKII